MMSIDKVDEAISKLNAEFYEITKQEDFSPFTINSNGDDYGVQFMGIQLDEYYDGEIKTPFECFIRHQAFDIIRQLAKWSDHGRTEGADGSDRDQAFVEGIIQEVHKYYSMRDVKMTGHLIRKHYGDGGSCLEISARGHAHRFNLNQINKDVADAHANHDLYLAELVCISVSHAMINGSM